jgi:hypothetical protein
MKTITIQPATRPTLQLPYPFHIDEEGNVLRQDFWNGEPSRVIGFSPIEESRFHEDQIDVTEFLKDPNTAIGMYPIMEHADGKWFTYKDKIESVSVNEN